MVRVLSMKRIPSRELLDTDEGTPAEVAASLGDLQTINSKFGGVTTTQAMVEHVARKMAATSLSHLEVAAGAGYVPGMVRERVQHAGLTLNVTLLDRVPSHLAKGDNGTRSVVADALELPFADSSFDLVSCGLFAHHLSPPQVVQFLKEALRVCRVAVLVNDLVRHPLHLALVYAAWPLYHSRLTRHDAPASVRQAYTPEEMRELVAQTAASRVEIQQHYLFRMGVIVWK